MSGETGFSISRHKLEVIFKFPVNSSTLANLIANVAWQHCQLLQDASAIGFCGPAWKV